MTPKWVVMYPDSFLFFGYLDKNLNIVKPRLNYSEQELHIPSNLFKQLIGSFKGDIVGKPNDKAKSIKCFPYECHIEKLGKKWFQVQEKDLVKLSRLFDQPIKKHRINWKDSVIQQQIRDKLKAGKSLSRIAKDFGVSRSTIVKANQRQNGALYPIQVRRKIKC